MDQNLSQEELFHTMRRKLRRTGAEAETEQWLESLRKNAEPETGSPGLIPVMIGPNLCALALDASATSTAPKEIAQSQYKMMNSMNSIMFEVQEILDRIKQRDELVHNQLTTNTKQGKEKSSPVFKQQPPPKSECAMTVAPTPRPQPKQTGTVRNDIQRTLTTSMKAPDPISPNSKLKRTPPQKRTRSGPIDLPGADTKNFDNGSQKQQLTPRKIKFRQNIQFFTEDEPMDVDM